MRRLVQGGAPVVASGLRCGAPGAVRRGELPDRRGDLVMGERRRLPQPRHLRRARRRGRRRGLGCDLRQPGEVGRVVGQAGGRVRAARHHAERVHEVPGQHERVPQRAQEAGRHDLLDRDENLARRERRCGVQPAGPGDLHVARRVGALRMQQEHVQVKPAGLGDGGVLLRPRQRDSLLAGQQVAAAGQPERHGGQVLLGGLKPGRERVGRPFVDLDLPFLHRPAEQRGQSEDVQAGEAEHDPGDRPGAEQDLQREAAAPAHVDQVAGPARGQCVHRGQRQPGEQGAAHAHPAPVRDAGHELPEGHERGLVKHRGRRRYPSRSAHGYSFQRNVNSTD